MDTSNHDSVISESAYLFDKKALQLGSKFFNIQDVSLLKVGTYGYVTSMFSHAMRDSTFHKNMLFNEFFLSGSSLNSTLYNWAKILNYDIDLASPASLPVALKINLDQLQRISTPVVGLDNTLVYTISRDTIFDVGGFNFLLPYDLKITTTKNTAGQTTITAIYNFDNFNIKPANIKSPYIKTTISSDNGNLSVIFLLNIYQIERKEYYFTMASNDILDVGIIEQNYGGNIVNFRAMYSDNSSNIDNFINLETIFNEINKPATDYYTYYTYIGDDTLRIYFSNKSGDFRPIFNSKLKIETFTTQAEKGNFNFSGTVTVRDSNLEGIAYTCLPLSSSSTGGASTLTFRDTKIAIMQKLRTRDGISTSYDLETFFAQVKKESLKTNSEFKVVKLRDDILRRQMSLYILLRNSNNELIPSNTVNMEFSLEELQATNYSLKPGTMVVYDRITRTYRLLEDDELPEPYMQSSDSYLYCIPFLINFDFKEFPKANLYLTNYSSTIGLSYDYLNTQTPYEIIVNNFNIERNPLTDINSFRISTFVNTNTLNVASIKIRALIYKDGTAIGYADMSKVGSTSEFNLVVNAPDEFDKDGNYIIRDTFYSIESGELIPEILLDGSYYIKLGFLYYSELNGQEKRGVFSKMTDIDNYILVSILAAEDPVTFATDLTDILYCQLGYNEFTGKIAVKHIPLIGALAYLNQDQNTTIMNEINSWLTVAQGASTTLENNTKVDIKFYNTYGVSKYFDIDTIDLKLKMTLGLNTSITRTTEQEIKDFIAQYLDSCNTTSDKRFSFSNLIRLLETTFPIIKYIKFFNVNGGNIQTIQQVKYLDSKLDTLPIDYVPEYLNIKKTLPVSGGINWFEFFIDIEYE